MIKNDFIQLLLQLDTTHREYANTGSEYITIGGFIIRIADHFTVKTSTHDLDVIFLEEDLISMLKTCKSASIEKRIERIKTTFGVSDSDIEEYIVQYTITYDKTRIIQ